MMANSLQSLFQAIAQAGDEHELRSPLTMPLGRSQPTSFKSLNINRLTPREIQIAELITQRLTNDQIGASLWITENFVKPALKRMFRQLEVSSRAEMVARLSSCHKDFPIQG
ncbi:MAG TPA: helix-turn-helix transcriptional regulator [Oculatellaceae cyanobacterium]